MAAASRGVETDVEVIKYLFVDADVVMTASALLRRGPQHVATMRERLDRWLGANGFDSGRDLQPEATPCASSGTRAPDTRCRSL
jgi:dihydroorotate dehydrogenase (fumarate)